MKKNENEAALVFGFVALVLEIILVFVFWWFSLDPLILFPFIVLFWVIPLFVVAVVVDGMR